MIVINKKGVACIFGITLMVFTALGHHSWAGYINSNTINNFHDCFYHSIAKRPTAYSDIFLFEYLIAQLRPKSESSTREFEHPDHMKTLCENAIVAYKKRRSKTIDHQKLLFKEKPDLARLGYEEIEAYAYFVGLVQNTTGIHIYGHADITRDAARTQGFSKEATHLLARAAQTPDLYKWEDIRYHAHSQTPSNIKDRETNIKRGVSDFQKLLLRITETVVSKAENNRADALYYLGVACHLVQDLRFHNGMTLRQHAILSYTLDSDPDLPKDIDLRLEINQKAISDTLRLLNFVEEKLEPTQWQRLKDWTGDDSITFVSLSKRIYGGQQQTMTYWALIKYWALSLGASNNPTFNKDLFNKNIIRWDNEKVLESIFKKP